MHIPLVVMITEEVEATMKQLLTQILNKLSSDLSLAGLSPPTPHT